MIAEWLDWIIAAAALAWAIFGFWAAAHALMYKRDSRSALGWAMLCLFAPYVGPLIYLTFGINRISSSAKRLGHLPAFRPVSGATRATAGKRTRRPAGRGRILQHLQSGRAPADRPGQPCPVILLRRRRLRGDAGRHQARTAFCHARDVHLQDRQDRAPVHQGAAGRGRARHQGLGIDRRRRRAVLAAVGDAQADGGPGSRMRNSFRCGCYRRHSISTCATIASCSSSTAKSDTPAA